MQTHTTTYDLRSRQRELLTWLPLAVLVLACLAATGGMRFTPGAFGASANDTTLITGTVDKEVHLDTSACTGAAVLDLGVVVPDDPAKTTSSDCPVTFGSNNSSLGADLLVREDPTTPVAPIEAMKCICLTDSIADFQGAAMPAAPASAFGMSLASAGGAAAGVWGVSPAVYDVQDASDLACQTASAADGTCNFRYSIMASSGSDTPGSYQAIVQFVALAR